MNTLELKTTLDVFGITEKRDETRRGRHGTNETIYNWKGITIAFGGSYYTVIGGQVPYTVAKIMSKKYPNHRDDVRIDGTYGYGRTRDKKYYDKDELGNSYIDCYHIDSKEGLIYLLSEIQYYHENHIYTEELRRIHYRKQRAIIAEVNRRLIEYGNPYKDNEEWLQSHGMIGVGTSEAALEILPFVKAFDETVNPFCNTNYEMKKPEEYMDKVGFKLFADSNDRLKMSISSKDGLVEHSRSLDEDRCEEYITHSSYYRVDPNTTMNVHHYISAKNNENVICLYRYHDDYSQEDKLDLRFDLISGIAYRTYAKDDEKKPITEEQKTIMIAELVRATTEAEKVTFKNMATLKTAHTLVKHK